MATKKNPKKFKDPEFLYENRFNTRLTPGQKKEFNAWLKEESVRQGRDISRDMGAYDVQGFWKEFMYKNSGNKYRDAFNKLTSTKPLLNAGIKGIEHFNNYIKSEGQGNSNSTENPYDEDMHAPDTYKKPNHPTFSKESKYHDETDDRRYGGTWEEDGGFTPSKQLTDKYEEDYYHRLFNAEPDRPEYLKNYTTVNMRLVKDIYNSNSDKSLDKLQKWGKKVEKYDNSDWNVAKKQAINQLITDKSNEVDAISGADLPVKQKGGRLVTKNDLVNQVSQKWEDLPIEQDPVYYAKQMYDMSQDTTRYKLSNEGLETTPEAIAKYPQLQGLKNIPKWYRPFEDLKTGTSGVIPSYSGEQIDLVRQARRANSSPNRKVPKMAYGGPMMNPYINFEGTPMNLAPNTSELVGMPGGTNQIPTLTADQVGTIASTEQNPNAVLGTESNGVGNFGKLAGNPGTYAAGAALGTSLIDAFATEDKVRNHKVDVNKGADTAKGALKGAATGAAMGSAIPVIGTAIGAGIGGIVGGISGLVGSNKKEDALQEEYDTNRSNSMAKTRLSQMKPQPGYLPVAESGGFLSYKGQSHDGPDGGIAVDSTGSPVNVTKNQPVALTEKNEVVWFNPENQSPYVFSDKSGFAKTAQKYIKKYKLDKSDSLAKNDKLVDDSVNQLFTNLMTAQELYNQKNPSAAPKSERMLQRGGGINEPPGYEDYMSAAIIRPNGNLGDGIPTLSANQVNTLSGTPTTPGLNLMNRRYGDIASSEYIPFNQLNDENSKFSTAWAPNDLSAYEGSVENWYNQSYLPHMTGNTNYMNPSGNQQHILDQKIGREHENITMRPMEMRGMTSNSFGLAGTDDLVGMPDVRSNIEGVQANAEEYDPRLSPLGHILSGVSSLADYSAYKRNKPEDVSLGRFAPEQVSYAMDRANRVSEGEAAKRSGINTARNMGVNAGGAMANMTAATTGVNRLLGQQVSESFEREANTNAQLRTQANQMNAQLQSQEALYNNQLSNNYRRGLVDRNPLRNLPLIGASYFKDNAAYQTIHTARQMDSPNATFTAPEYKTKLGKFLDLKAPNVKYR